VDFWKITFTDVLVSGVQQGQQQGAHPTETISLAFAEYGVEYQEQDNKGAKKGGPIKHGFNVQKGQKV
jgi:type VI secretion system secreted protein Hcp